MTHYLGPVTNPHMRKTLTLTIVAAAILALPQIAFSGPERYSGKDKEVAVVPPAPCTWTGFYIGGQVGFGGGDFTWKDTDFGETNPEILTHEVPIGVILGGQLGYNRQFGQWLVLGVEGEFAYSDISDNQVKADGDETDTYHVRNNWMGSIAMRVGFTSMNNRLLTYAKGGAMFERWEYDWTHQEGTNPGDSYGTQEWRSAPFVGFGLEYAINCHWSAKVEYKHPFLGTRTLNDTRFDHPNFEPESYDHELHQDSVGFGLNYKF